MLDMMQKRVVLDSLIRGQDAVDVAASLGLPMAEVRTVEREVEKRAQAALAKEQARALAAGARKKVGKSKGVKVSKAAAILPASRAPAPTDSRRDHDWRNAALDEVHRLQRRVGLLQGLLADILAEKSRS